ncbi:hypothetical protein DL771_005350 [Monosporascus sp. 5C6A]|nr:hypothetical protein DL771_005350 [Monosporascus sp. 5C6A]
MSAGLTSTSNVPFAVVQRSSEQDVVSTVLEALNVSVRFVPASGGHSLWSTIGREGIVIDLTVGNANTVGTIPYHISSRILWGVCGAGQFLGLVTEITIETYPYPLLGSTDGQSMCGTYIFLPQQMDAICAALEAVMSNESYVSARHFMIVQAPPDLKHKYYYYKGADRISKLKVLKKQLDPTGISTKELLWAVANGILLSRFA